MNAVSFVHAHPKTKGHPIILMGWGMGGGLILEGSKSLTLELYPACILTYTSFYTFNVASRLTPKLHALIATNGFYNSPRVQKALRGDAKNKEFLAWLEEERGAGTRGPKSMQKVEQNILLFA